MSYKLRAYRVAGDATCPEAIISHLLLYALLYILKHVTRNGRVAANELNKILSHRKARKGIAGLPIQVVRAIASPSNALRVPPIRSMRPASLRDALALSTCRSLLPIAVAISFAVAIGFAWIASKTALSVTDSAFVPTTLPTTITAIPDIIPDICSASWNADLVARLVPLAAPWRLNLCHERGGLPSHARQAEAGQSARLKFQRQTHPVRLPELLEQGIGLAGALRALAQRVVTAACPLPNVEQAEHGEERPVARVGHAARLQLAYRDPKRAWVGRDDAVRLPHEDHTGTPEVVRMNERVREHFSDGSML